MSDTITYVEGIELFDDTKTRQRPSLYGDGEPTEAIEEIGEFYLDKTNQAIYFSTIENGKVVWKKMPTIVQEGGTSEDDVMSQKATTDAINNIDTQIQIFGRELNGVNQVLGRANGKIEDIENNLDNVIIPAIKEVADSIPDVKQSIWEWGEEGPSKTDTVSQMALVVELNNYIQGALNPLWDEIDIIDAKASSALADVNGMGQTVVRHDGDIAMLDSKVNSALEDTTKNFDSIQEIKQDITDIENNLDTKADTTQVSNRSKGLAKGRAARVEDMWPETPLNISFTGESIQDAEPTIEAPVEVTHCENPTFKLFKNNLLKYPYRNTSGSPGGLTAVANEDGSITLNGTTDHSQITQTYHIFNSNTPIITLRKGLVYKVKHYDKNGNLITDLGLNMRICEKDQWTTVSEIANSRPLTKDRPIHRVLLYINDDSNGRTYNNFTFYPTLVVVNDDEVYDKYDNFYSLTIPLTLAGKGDYRDEIVVDQNAKTVTHIQRYFQYKFTQNEEWQGITPSDAGTTRAFCSLSEELLPRVHVSAGLCNMIPYSTAIYNSEDKVGLYATFNTNYNTPQIYARINISNATADDFKAVFNQDAYIWCPLMTPIETDCTDTEWGQALLDLTIDKEAFTFDCDANIKFVYDQDINSVTRNIKGRYALLEAITTKEELSSYIYKVADNNRAPLKAAFVRLEIPAGSASGMVNVYFEAIQPQYKTLTFVSTSMINTSARYWNVEAIKEFDKWRSTRNGGSSVYENALYSMTYAPTIYGGNIDQIRILTATSGVLLPKGIKISIYGVEE